MKKSTGRSLGKRCFLILSVALSCMWVSCGQIIPDMGVTILSPKAKEAVKAETSYEIQWKTEIPESEFGKTVLIEFSKDGGKSWEKVEENVRNTRNYVWKVPKMESNECKIRIYSQDKSKYRGTSDAFSVR